MNVHELAGLRVGEGEMGGVGEVAVELEFGGKIGDEVWSAVKRVADDGVTEGLGVDSDLMGASGFDAHLDKGEGTIGSSETFEDVEV